MSYEKRFKHSRKSRIIKMTVIEIIYPAKCKDCKYLERFYKGKRTLHRCGNQDQPSEWKKEQLPARTKACELFKLKYT